MDVLGCLLSVTVHAANIHDTKSGISTARQACERYPSIQKFCADAGYRGTFVSDENGSRMIRRNMSVEKEAEILAPFKKRAEKGEIIEVSEIEAAYQAEVDHPIGNSQIYFVLHRHGWRKVMPRSKHPKKASEEVIETSKKLRTCIHKRLSKV